MHLQIAALGRAGDGKILASEGHDLVAPSALPISGKLTPRALTKIEIKHFINLFAEAAHKAVFRAGFDGVEIHGASGMYRRPCSSYNVIGALTHSLRLFRLPYRSVHSR